MPFNETNNMAEQYHLSPPVDTLAPFDTASLAGKTIVVTGGASGFGAAFAWKWAKLGAHLAIGDVNDAAGETLVAELRAQTPGGQHHFYQHCDVTDWDSQVAFFRAAVENSATGRIHAVVPNAGIADTERPTAGKGFECPNPPAGATGEADPQRPNLAVIQVNYIGVLYSVHLGLYWLERNGSGIGPNASKAPESSGKADRHLLLVSSVAGVMPLPGQALYTSSKHGVTGLFRAIRATSHMLKEIRVNMLCPYFADTPIVPVAGKLLLAGGGLAEVDDVVDAATRLMADESIVGRALMIGPPMCIKEDEADTGVPTYKLVAVPENGGSQDKGVKTKAVWDCYAEDYTVAEVFLVRFVHLLNLATMMRGWKGWFRDVARVLFKRTKP